VQLSGSASRNLEFIPWTTYSDYKTKYLKSAILNN